jgi:hypothetical protein
MNKIPIRWITYTRPYALQVSAPSPVAKILIKSIKLTISYNLSQKELARM